MDTIDLTPPGGVTPAPPSIVTPVTPVQIPFDASDATLNAKAVRFDQKQSLTDEQKSQALANIGGSPQVAMVVAVCAGGDAIPSSVVTPLTFSRVICDSGGNYDPVNVVVPRAGWYDIDFSACFSNATAAATRASVTVIVTSPTAVITVASGESEFAIGGYPVLAARGTYFLGAGEPIGVSVFHDAITPQSLSASPDRRPTLTIAEKHPALNQSSRKVVGGGDSIMSGYYCGLANTMIAFLSSNTVNHGTPGWTTADVLAGIAWLIGSADNDADLVLFVTTNDLLAGTAVETMVSNLTAIVAATVSIYRRVVWVTPCPGASYPIAPEDYEANRQELIAAVVAANINGLLIARTDLAPLIGADGDEVEQRVFYEKLHPTPYGEYLISEVIRPLLD